MMAGLTVRLFGRLSISLSGGEVVRIESRKAQGLLCYLLVYRSRAHTREILANLIWGDHPADRSKKYLRHALWQIQSALAAGQDASDGSAQQRGSHPSLLLLDADWVQVNPQAGLWLDVAEFEQAYNLTRGQPGSSLDASAFQALQGAAALYRGNLLEGCYEDWCLFEQERLQNMFLAILDKLIDYCLAHQEYEHGLAFGERILQVDIAQEHAHRKLIRLYTLCGRRAEALRQFERCAQALKDELGVEPAHETLALYERVCNDQLSKGLDTGGETLSGEAPSQAAIHDLLLRLNPLRETLEGLQRELSEQIRLAEMYLSGRR